MDYNLLLFIFKLVCSVLSAMIMIDFITSVIKLKKAKLAQFFVKTAFAFERNESLVGALTYYTEASVQKELIATGLTLGEYVTEHLPALNFPLETVTLTTLNITGVPVRAIIRKDLVERYSTLIIQSDNAVVTINRLGTNPKTSWWFGTAIISNNKDAIKIITLKYRKAMKHDPNCYVVRT